MKLKDGTVIPKGTKCEISWEPDKATQCLVTVNGRPIRIATRKLPNYFNSIEACPDLEELEDCIVQSIYGENVEPDGWDEDGSPSWLLALNMI